MNKSIALLHYQILTNEQDGENDSDENIQIDSSPMDADLDTGKTCLLYVAQIWLL